MKGEKIPHAQKVFSVFETHTRWVSKGKAGNPVELGVPVCVVEDQRRHPSVESGINHLQHHAPAQARRTREPKTTTGRVTTRHSRRSSLQRPLPGSLADTS